MRKIITYIIILAYFAPELSAQDKPLTLFKETYTNVASGYSYVICSDPQFFFQRAEFKRKVLNSDWDKEEARIRSKQWVNSSVKAINSYDNVSVYEVKGVIINGDLTDDGSETQLDTFKKIYGKLESPIKLYPGLGNHDFNKKPENARRMINYLYTTVIDVLEIPEYIKGIEYASSFDSESSFAYSWNEGNIHFVQLNMYPTFETEISYNGENHKIQSSMSWLKQDLATAVSNKKQIILNFHVPGPNSDGPSFSWLEETEFVNLIKEFPPLAIFTGHLHSKFGTYPIFDYWKIVLPCPVFISGSVFNGDLFIVDILSGYIMVRQYNTDDGVLKVLKRENGLPEQWPIKFKSY